MNTPLHFVKMSFPSLKPVRRAASAMAAPLIGASLALALSIGHAQTPAPAEAPAKTEAEPLNSALGAALFHMATNRAFDPARMLEADGYLGAANGQHLWLIADDHLGLHLQTLKQRLAN